MRHLDADRAMGRTNEEICLPILETHLNTTLKKNKWNAVFDFKNDTEDIWVELKSRRVNHNKYPTTIITKNKLAVCTDDTKSYYIAYKFEDGVYIIRYNKALFDTFPYDDNYLRSPRGGISNTPQKIVFIPIKNLTRVH